jgi:hypothetical protein
VIGPCIYVAVGVAGVSIDRMSSSGGVRHMVRAELVDIKDLTSFMPLKVELYV